MVENVAGNSGAIGVDRVAKAAPDGYTLMWAASAALTILPSLQRLPFDPMKDLAPIGIAFAMPTVFLANKDFPPRNIQELVAYARANPGKVSYGTPGVGTPQHIAGELFCHQAGIKMEHIPYRGGADVARELAGGRLDAGIISFSSLRPAVERGTTLLASTAAERQASLRQIPVIAETYPGYDLVSWTGCFAPAGTPEAAQMRFVAAIHHALKDPAIQARLEATGADPVISSPGLDQAVIAKDREVARRIVAATGISIS